MNKGFFGSFELKNRGFFGSNEPSERVFYHLDRKCCDFLEKAHLNIQKWIKSDNLFSRKKPSNIQKSIKTGNLVSKKYTFNFLRKGLSGQPGIPAQAPFRKKWVWDKGRGNIARTPTTISLPARWTVLLLKLGHLLI